VPFSYSLKLYRGDTIEYIYNSVNSVPEDRLAENTQTDIPIVP